MLKVGIMGTGRVLDQMIPALRTGFKIEAIASRAVDRSFSVASNWDIPSHYGSYEELIADDNVQVVYIALPNSLHAKWTIRALNAGKHVLVEKPITLSCEELDQVAEASQRSSRVVMEALWYRFHPQVSVIQNIVSSGELGALIEIKSSLCFKNDDLGDIRWSSDLGGGSIYDLFCYQADFLNHICGIDQNNVQNIRATGRSFQNVTGSASLKMKLFNDADVSFVSSIERNSSNHTVISGRLGSILIPNLLMFPGISQQYLKIRRKSEVSLISFDNCNPYAAMVGEFARHLTSGDGKVVSISDSYSNVKWIEKVNSEIKLFRVKFRHLNTIGEIARRLIESLTT